MKRVNLKVKLVTLLITALLSFNIYASNLEELYANLKAANLSKKHPDYLALQGLDFLLNKHKSNPREIIDSFENALINKDFKGIIENDQNSTFRIGAKGGFSMWRDIIQLSLGNAYYQLKDYDQALKYFSLISAPSPFRGIALIHQNYVLMGMKKLDKVKLNLKELDNIKLQSNLVCEVRIQHAFISNNEKSYDQSIKILAQDDCQKNLTEEVATIYHRVLSDSYLKKYLKTYNDIPVSEKKALLEKAIFFAEKVPMSKRDSDFSYHASESYWLLASIYRVEDPVANKEKWMGLLKHGVDWIFKHVTSTFKHGESPLSEEAYFFGISLLWEREEFTQALSYLKALPEIYPQGIYRADAYQLLGDYYFDHQQYNQAIDFYRELAKVGSEDKATYGIYKAGWSFYNTDQKWKALRHFEQLLRYYTSKKQENSKDQLKKEARQDFILLASEVMSANEALHELDVIIPDENVLIDLKAELAAGYTNIGRFTESIKSLAHLIEKYPTDSRSLIWLAGLMRDTQSKGDRLKVADAAKQYFPFLMDKNNDFTKKPELYKEFVAAWGDIQLSINREGLKTDDADVLLASDTGYDVYEKLIGDKGEARVYFYGAQRWEKKKQDQRALNWYQLASVDKSFELNKDALLNFIRILHTKSEDLSIKPDKEKLKNEYAFIEDKIAWCLKNCTDLPQFIIAKKIYVESLFQQGKDEQAREFVASEFKKLGFNDELWNLYLTYNNQLYHAKKYSFVYQLSDTVLKTLTMDKLPPKNREAITAILQESSFLHAFHLEKTKGDVGEMRKWYGYSLQYNSDKSLYLKSIHNELLSYSNSEWGSYFKQLTQSQNYLNGLTVDQSNKDLLTGIVVKTLDMTKNNGREKLRADYLLRYSKLTDDSEKAQEAIWQSVLTSAKLNDLTAVEASIKTLNIPALDENKKVVLAKIYLYMGKYDRSWSYLEPVLKAASKDDSAWVVFRDLYRLTYNNDLGANLQQYIIQHRSLVEKLAILSPLKSNFTTNEDLIALENSIKTTPSRSIASDSSDKTSNDFDQFKARVSRVPVVMKEYEKRLSTLSPSLTSPYSQIALKASCLMPNASEMAINDLQSLKAPVINTPQWSDFVAKVDAKIQEFTAIKADQFKECEELKVKLAQHLLSDVEMARACKDSKKCFQEASSSPEKIEAWGIGQKEPKLDDANFDALFKLGAMAKIEELIEVVADADEKLYWIGRFRLAMGDLYTASTIVHQIKGESYSSLLKDKLNASNGKLIQL